MSTFEKLFWIAVKIAVFLACVLLMFGGGLCGVSFLANGAGVFGWLGAGVSLGFIIFMGSFAMKAGKFIPKNDAPPYGISLFSLWTLLMIGWGSSGLLLTVIGAQKERALTTNGLKMLAEALLAALITILVKKHLRNKGESSPEPMGDQIENDESPDQPATKPAERNLKTQDKEPT